MNFKGAAKPIDDIDLPRIGALIGVGEDPIHALLEVETLGSGFDNQGRPKLLFEPHKFYKHLKGDQRTEAVAQGLAYPKWGQKKYPRESYTRMEAAMKINPHAALLSGSWGLGQIMGENYAMAGYDSVEEMVQAFIDDEENHLSAMINFIKASGIDDDLRRIEKKIDNGQVVTAADWVPVVRVYNGAGYAKNDYHNRASRALAKWRRIKDTPWRASEVDIRDEARLEELEHKTNPKTSPEPEVSAQDTAKGVTTSVESSDNTEGTPPPTPAVEVVASRPSLKSTAAAIVTALMAPLSYLGIDTKQVGEYAKGNVTLALKLGLVLAFVIIGVWIWNKAMERANQRTLKVMDAAKDKHQNNLRLIDPPSPPVPAKENA